MCANHSSLSDLLHWFNCSRVLFTHVFSSYNFFRHCFVSIFSNSKLLWTKLFDFVCLCFENYLKRTYATDSIRIGNRADPFLKMGTTALLTFLNGQIGFQTCICNFVSNGDQLAYWFYYLLTHIIQRVCFLCVDLSSIDFNYKKKIWEVEGSRANLSSPCTIGQAFNGQKA